MADALQASRTKRNKTVLCLCLAHARRKFVEIESHYPKECEQVLTWLASVYANDAKTKAQGLTAAQRLAYHQKHSQSAMDHLEEWVQGQRQQTEPNGNLGKALAYLHNHWAELTRFLKQEGAPLDNNIVEATLKVAIRHRKNSLFYKNEHSALVGDIFMSLIHTCQVAGENPFDYLTKLQDYRREIRQNPEDWMPWNYHQTLVHLGEAA